jgi:hypothetical protein
MATIARLRSDEIQVSVARRPGGSVLCMVSSHDWLLTLWAPDLDFKYEGH